MSGDGGGVAEARSIGGDLGSAEAEGASVWGREHEGRARRDGAERGGREGQRGERANGGEGRLLLGGVAGSGFVAPAVGQHGGSTGDGDVDGGGEGEDVDDDNGVGRRGEAEQAREAPFTAQMVFGLIEEHRC